jgi:hypothetical protein
MLFSVLVFGVAFKDNLKVAIIKVEVEAINLAAIIKVKAINLALFLSTF